MMDFDLKLLQWPAIPFTCQIFGQSVSKKIEKIFFIFTVKIFCFSVLRQDSFYLRADFKRKFHI